MNSKGTNFVRVRILEKKKNLWKSWYYALQLPSRYGTVQKSTMTNVERHVDGLVCPLYARVKKYARRNARVLYARATPALVVAIHGRAKTSTGRRKADRPAAHLTGSWKWQRCDRRGECEPRGRRKAVGRRSATRPGHALMPLLRFFARLFLLVQQRNRTNVNFEQCACILSPCTLRLARSPTCRTEIERN